MASDSFDLANLSGYGGSRKRKSGRSAGTLSREDARAFAARLIPDAPSGPSSVSDEGLAALGQGGKDAARLLEQIEASDMPDAMKREARRRFEEGGVNESPGPWSRITGTLGDSVGMALHAIDKSKRAVIASLEELQEELPESMGGLSEDGRSWADNVLRAPSYGGGEWVQHMADDAEDRGHDDPLTNALSSKWGARTAGLVADIALDPLTYITFGASGAAKAAGKGGVELAAREGTEALAREGTEAVAREGVKRGTKVQAREVARMLDDVGRTDAAERVLRANSTMAATAEELAAVGLRGGTRLAGIPIIPHDATRALGGRAVAAGKSGAAGTDVTAGLRKVFGANDELRTLARRGVDGDAMTAVRELDGLRAERLASARFGGQLGDELNDLLKETRKAKVKGSRLTEALRAGKDSDAFRVVDEATDGLATKYADWFEKVRLTANDRAGREFVAQRPDYVPRILTDEVRDVMKLAGDDAGGRGARGSFERSALKAGDSWMGHTLVDGTPIEDQMRRIARAEFGDDAVELLGTTWPRLPPPTCGA